MYTKYTFCIHCAKYIIAAGVKRVVYGKVYRHASCVEYLRQAGVQVDEYQSNKDWDRRVAEIYSRDIEVRMAKEGDVKLEEKHQRD